MFLVCVPVPQEVLHACQFPGTQLYVQPEVLLQLWLVDGLLPLQLPSLTVAPSLRRHVTLRDWLPLPQLFEHEPQPPVFQLYVQPEVLLQLWLDAGALPVQLS